MPPPTPAETVSADPGRVQSSGGGSDVRELAVARQLLERTPLDLTSALTRDAELVPDRLQRQRIPAAEPEPELEHPSLLLAQALERVRESAVLEADGELRERPPAPAAIPTKPPR